MSNKNNFTHLHVHSSYSLLDGISKREDIIQLAKKFGMKGVAMTEHGNIYNAISFYKECISNNIIPIIGCEFYVAPDSHLNRSYATKAEAAEDAKNGDLSMSAYHLTVLAKNRAGYENLKKLTSIAWQYGFYRKPRIDDELLSTHREGLIVLSGCLASKVARLIVAGNKVKAIEEINKMRSIFGDDFYLEVMAHDIEEEKIVREALIDIGKSHGIPIVLTGDSHFTAHGHELAHEAALAIGTGTTLDDPNRWRFHGSGYWFKSPEEMWDIADLANIPAEALTNTMVICNKIDDYGIELTSRTKKFIVPAFKDENGNTLTDEECHQILELKAFAGLAERGKAHLPNYIERLNQELSMMKKKNFSSYFLIIADIIDFIRKSGIIPPVGRGSSVGSLVCYSLYITGIDPIEMDIPFSRFINDGRKDLPDVDTDISQEFRGEVLKYITNKYGADRVAHIITFQSMRPKAAIDNVGRVLGVPHSVRKQVTKDIHDDPTSDDKLDDYLNASPTTKALIDQVPNWHDISVVLEGNHRNAGLHAAGIVISNDPLIEKVPLVKTADDGILVTQYDMGDIAELGLLKLDMLGLKTIDLIQHTLAIIKERHGIEIDWHKIPLDDANTYRTIASGKYVSIFQYDSNGMRALAKQLVPTKFDHLVAMNALYRPGPMNRVGNEKTILEHYVDRRHNREPIETWHPELDKLFAPTLGLCLFQEQLMGLAMIMAGFSEVEADEYRAAVGKKDKAKFQEAQKKFIEAGVAYGRPREVMEDLASRLEGFARYGWNKGHAVAYSYISYVTAWLETNFQLEYYTALLNVNIGEKADKMKAIIAPILQKGIKLEPPDINKSGPYFHTDGNSIYMGLYSVRQVGEKALTAILNDRQRYGPYKDYIEFMVRMGPYGEVNRTVKENLIKAGALRFDTSVSDKQKVLHIEPIQKLFKKFEGKLSTDKIAEEIRNKIQFVQGDEYSQQERLNNEKSVLSFYISSHPVMQYNLLFSLFPDINVISPAELQEQEPGTRVAVFGAIESKLQKLTKNNKLYLDLRVGDQVAAENIKIWSPLAELVSSVLIQDQLVILAGIVKEDKFMQGAVQLNVSTVTPILTNVGIPVSGIAAANAAICNRVAQVLNAIPGEVTETETAAMMIFKQNAYIKPDHFDMLKSIRGVHYDLAFNSIQDPDIIHGKRYRRHQ